MGFGYEGKLYVLAFDHRQSFEKLFGVVDRRPTSEEARRISEAKEVIFEGFERALRDGVPRDSASILVDGQYGRRVALMARERGHHFAIPVERSGEREFDFEHGEAFGQKIAEFDPTFSKVLVRLNPEGDAAMNARHFARLRRLSDWLHERDRKLLFELLVPAEDHHLAAVKGDEDRYDDEIRPLLMVRAIEQMQEAGVEPDIWKIEGIGDRGACRRVAEVARGGGRDRVACVVLGRGASAQRVEQWLRAASGLPGYAGFAIGRSIFAEAVSALATDPNANRAACAYSVARSYRRFVEVYEQALREQAETSV